MKKRYSVTAAARISVLLLLGSYASHQPSLPTAPLPPRPALPAATVAAAYSLSLLREATNLLTDDSGKLAQRLLELAQWWLRN